MRKSAAAAWRGAIEGIKIVYSIADSPGAPLKLGNTYSPFGILCEMHRIYTCKGEWSGFITLPQVYCGNIKTLPSEVKEWAGLTDRDVEYLTGKDSKVVFKWLRQFEQTDSRVLGQFKLFRLDQLAPVYM